MCDRCSEYDNKNKNGIEITEQENQDHEIHLIQAEKMSSMMHYWEDNCKGPIHTPRDKDGIHVAQDKQTCDDLVARISTDMMQIQTVPRLTESVAYFKSKVNEISTPNK